MAVHFPSRKPSLLALVSLLAAVPFAPRVSAQLGPPPVPPENPITAAKVRLGKTLFWDEQLSSTGTMACGTCHQPSAGFADPRSLDLVGDAVYPGVDRIFGTDDDALGSPSLPRLRSDGTYDWVMGFGAGLQVTRRNAPTVVNAAYEPALFLDGRATDVFVDPATGAVISPAGAALETQVLEPLLSHVEMGVLGRTTAQVSAKLRWMMPLADAESIPADLENWLGTRRYPALFDEVYGDPRIDGVRMAQAMASYLRTLVTHDLPYDRFLGGDTAALTPLEQTGHALFHGAAGCADCHSGPLLTDHAYHNIGVDAFPDEAGRREVTHDPQDHGRFRTPGLRNVELTAPYFHDGSARTLEEVVEFYDRGGDHAAPNLAPEMQPLGLSGPDRAALVAFLRRPLTDPRIVAEVAPFDRPRLFTQSTRAPALAGIATAGSGGFAPRMVLLEVPRRGRTITVGVDRGLGGAPAALLSSTSWLPAGQPLLGATSYLPIGAGTRLDRLVLDGIGPGQGFGSVRYDLGTVPGAMLGTRLYMQWLIFDPGATGRLAASEAGVLLIQ